MRRAAWRRNRRSAAPKSARRATISPAALLRGATAFAPAARFLFGGAAAFVRVGADFCCCFLFFVGATSCFCCFFFVFFGVGARSFLAVVVLEVLTPG